MEKNNENTISLGKIVLWIILIYASIKFLPLGGLIGNYYLKPLTTVLESVAENDHEKFLSAFPSFFVDESDYSDEELNEMIELANKNWTEKYGNDIKVNGLINSREKVSTDELDAASLYASISKQQLIDIQKAYTMQVKITVSGSKTSTSVNASVIIAKINSEWVLLYMDDNINRLIAGQ